MANKTNLLDHRLRSLETILLWEGELDNKRIRDLFDLQNVQASRLIAKFKEAHPEMFKEYKQRMFLNDSFLQKAHIEDYVRLMYEVNDNPEAIEDVRTDLASVAPAIFSVIRNASLNKLGVDIRYASMTNPDGIERTIFPHTIVRAGRRWHVRAWCAYRKEYRDFAFGRIRSASASLTKLKILESDIHWETIININITAHKDLNDKQARVVRDEYFDGETEKVIQSRACLVNYLLQDIRAAIDIEKQTPPEYQLEVANVEEIKQYIWSS
jgi:predicted DNA-binding transcriptional regulator YafY